MIHNTFEKGPEGWCSYDYHASMVDQGKNVFVLTTWVPDGGKNKSGAVWSNHTRWSADTPERPLSILPLIFYRNWVNADPINLENDETLWHRSWSGDPDNPASLDTVLGRAHSYGFSFVGFTAEVTGRLSMAEFMITR